MQRAAASAIAFVLALDRLTFKDIYVDSSPPINRPFTSRRSRHNERIWLSISVSTSISVV